MRKHCKERQRNSPVDCFDISLTEQSEGERIPLGRPKKIAHFCVVSFLFLHQEGFEPEMGANSEQSEERSDRETVQWTVLTFL